MATINATVSISSDIMSYGANINKTMTMTKASTCTGLNQTTGLSSKRYTAVTQVVLHAYNTDTVTNGGANKVYIRNTGSDKAQYFIITLADTTDAVEEVGRLYAGDWLFIPWSQNDATNELVIQAINGSCPYEYAIFKEDETIVTGA